MMRLCYYICEVIVLKYNDDESELYKKMYLRLFNAVTDALEETDVNIKDGILRKAQQDCEEIYINNDND